jgi:hypothetical protein
MTDAAYVIPNDPIYMGNNDALGLSTERLTHYAERNFSNTMVRHLPASNILRLSQEPRSNLRRTRSMVVNVVSYIPFGIVRDTRFRTRTINYACYNAMKRYSYTVWRYHLFFSQLLRSGYLDQGENMYFGVHVSLQRMAPHDEGLPENYNFDYAKVRDFGTTNLTSELQADGTRTLRGALDTAIWPYDMFTIQGENAVQGLAHVSTPMMSKPNAMSTMDFVRLLKQRTLDALPIDSDSADPMDFRVMNCFLMVLNVPIGGGGPSGGLWLTAKVEGTQEEWIVNPRAVLVPKGDGQHCFWVCLMSVLMMRMRTSVDAWWYPLLQPYAELMEKDMNTTRSWNRIMTLFHSEARRFMHVVSQKEGVQPGWFQLPTPITCVEAISQWFGFRRVSVLGTDCKALVGTTDDLQNASGSAGDLILLLSQAHFSVVLSYTALLPIKECGACGQRFVNTGSLTKHLDSRSCLKCECTLHLKEHVQPFQSMTEWREHRNNLSTMCLFRTSPDLVKKDIAPRYKTAKRFPHDAASQMKYGKMNGGSDAFKLQQALEHNLADVRNHKEALFVDIESIVPSNGYVTSTSDVQYQQAYAVGWLKRSDASVGLEPSQVYGMDCIEQFVKYLDTWWDELYEDEVRVWRERATLSLSVESQPKITGRLQNYAYKLKKSWDLLDKKVEMCPICAQQCTTDHGYVTDGRQYQFSECCVLYWSRNVATKNMYENFNDNAPRVSVWAHNGGRYDWLFVHRYLMENNLLHLAKVVRGNGRYYEIMYKGVFCLRDSLNFMMASLDRLGKDFGVETLKGIFPYRFMDCAAKIDVVLEGEQSIRDQLKHSMFEISEKIDGPMGLSKKREMKESEYVEFFSQRQWVYNVREETLLYLRDDIKCLYQVVESFRQGWKMLPHQPELFQFCTIGQMCHTYFLSHYLAPKTYAMLDVMEDTFIRKALYGGRTEVFQRATYDSKPIHYVDVNSLYPYVMESKLLPSGDPEWYFVDGDPRISEFRGSQMHITVHVHTEQQMEQVREQLNDGTCTLSGFFEVDVKCPADAEFPILPQRMNGKNVFSNQSKSCMVYYSEELKFAIKRGCRVTKVYAVSSWQRSPVYANLILLLKAEKMRGEGKDVNGNVVPGMPKNPSLRAAAKTAQNALYGKSIQFINESTHIVDNQQDLYKLVKQGGSDVSILPIYRTEHSDIVEVTVKPHNPRIQRRSCSSIGTAILAEARLVLYQYFEEVLKVGGTILYCDTDSIVFTGDSPLPPECIDDARYGKMKVEIDPADIEPGGFVALAPKCYAFKLVDESPYVKCKGVNLSKNVMVEDADKSAFDELLDQVDEDELMEHVMGVDDSIVEEDTVCRLSYENLKALIEGEKSKIVTSQTQFMKTRDRRIAAVDSVKLLKDSFDKRKLLSHGCTVAWNDYNLDLGGAVERQDVEAVSNFLQQAHVHDIHEFIEQSMHIEWIASIIQGWLASGEFNVFYYNQIYGS